MMAAIFLLAILEKIALIDTFDFATVCDIERHTGTEFLFNHIRETGAEVMAWRHQSGGMHRFRSDGAEPTAPSDVPVSKLRIPETRSGYGFLNLHRGEIDLMRDQFDYCATNGVLPAVHFTLEENHYFSFTFSSWNLDHPEFWGVMQNGTPWPGHASYSFPEVIEHRVKILDELIDRGAKLIILGTDRLGGYGPRFEYTAKSIADWKAAFGTEPPKDFKNTEWIKHCGKYFENVLRALAKRCRERKVRSILMIRQIGLSFDSLLDENGVDWTKLAAEGIVDGIAPYAVYDKDLKDSKEKAFNVVDKIFARVAARKGKCDLYLPINAYSPGFKEVAKEAGVKPVEAVQKMLELATKHGAKGITLGVVDFGNYPADVRKTLSTPRFRCLSPKRNEE